MKKSHKTLEYYQVMKLMAIVSQHTTNYEHYGVQV